MRIRKLMGLAMAAAVCVAVVCAGCTPVQTARGSESTQGPLATVSWDQAETTPDSESGIFLTVDCDEPVYEIAWSTEGQSGGATPADGGAYAKGDCIPLDAAPDGFRIYTVIVYGVDHQVLAESAFTDDFSGGARVNLTMTADLQIIRPSDVEAPAYSIMKIGAGGEVLCALSPLSGEDAELAQTIIMDYMLKSAAWPGNDLADLESYYIIRESASGDTGEAHDYYAYLLDGNAVLQLGPNGHYSYLGDGLYQQLTELMEN